MATTTDLGKIMLTNGGEYNPDTVYSAKDFVLYRGSTYLALKTNSGIEPTDDRVNWQLLAQGFAGSEFEIEGYVYVENEEIEPPVGEPGLDADALGGNPPEYYAPQNEISDAFSETKDYAVGDYCIYLNALYKFTTAKAAGAWDGTAVVPVTLAQEIQEVKDNYYDLALSAQIQDGDDLDNYITPGCWRIQEVQDHNISHSPVESGGFKLIVDALGTSDYIRQTIKVSHSYDTYVRYRIYDDTEGVWQWGAWDRIATNSDLNNLETLIPAGITSSLVSGSFKYVKVGKIVIGAGTLTAIANVNAGSRIVVDLPKTYDGLPYPAFSTSAIANDFYINDNGAIVNRNQQPIGTGFRLSVVYIAK